MMQQLPLPIVLDDAFTFADFYVNDANVLLLKKLKTFSADARFLYLAGNSQSGRTHLLQATIAAHRENYSCFYLPLSQFTSFQPDILENMEQFSLVCLDDVDAVAGNAAWEKALFHAYNRMKMSATHFIVSAREVPAVSAFQLPDLKSRFSEMLIFSVKSASDQDKIKILMLRAKQRGLDLSSDVAEYILRHYSRDLKNLMQLLNQLDHAALAAQRKITIPFVREVL